MVCKKKLCKLYVSYCGELGESSEKIMQQTVEQHKQNTKIKLNLTPRMVLDCKVRLHNIIFLDRLVAAESHNKHILYWTGHPGLCSVHKIDDNKPVITIMKDLNVRLN